MTTSLPKIKTLADNSESGSQKQLKFKKLKLNTDDSAADIRQRFKSVRTQRLSSLERYSTVEGQREHKKEKIHLNLLERKLMAGTYDQTKETGNDLNSLKQKTDYYKTQALQRQTQTEKVKILTQELKIQIENLEAIKKKNDEAVAKVQRRFQQQKVKTDSLLYDRSSLEHMIGQRKRINLHLEAQINEDKQYLTKLKSVVKQVFNQARESKQSTKNLLSKVERINDGALREQRSREQIMYEKQTIINKRKDDEKLREEKSKEFRKSLDVAELENEKKDFMELYRGILAHLFFQRYSQVTMEDLQEKYQVVENMFGQISSYQKFDRNQPSNMVARFKDLVPETKAFEEQTKKLEKRQLDLENKQKQIEQRVKESKIVGSREPQLTKSKSIDPDELEHKEKEHQRKVDALKQQIKDINQAMFKIERWGQRYAREFEIKSKKAETPEDIGRNLMNLLKVVGKESQAMEGRKGTNNEAK